MSMATSNATHVIANEKQVVTFCLDEQEYALDVANVVEVVRMVAITKSSQAAGAFVGMINLRGLVIPVLNLRQCLGLPDKAISLDDQLLIVQVGERNAALIVDSVEEALIIPADRLASPQHIAAELAQDLDAVAKLGDRLLLIIDPLALLPEDAVRA